MRTFALAVAGMMLAGTLYGQEMEICGEFYAPWGSSQTEVVRAGAKASLNFKEINKANEDGVSQVTFLNGNIARIFTLMHGKYVSFSLLHLDPDSAKRDKYTAKQMQNVLKQVTELDEEGGWIVNCGQTTVKATMATKTGQATFRVLSITTLKELVNSAD